MTIFGSRGRTVATVSALVAVAALSPLPFMGSGEKESDPRIAKVVHRGFTVKVDTVGSLDTARSHMLGSDIKGNRGKVIFIVEDGAWVEKGDILVRLDPSPFEEEVLTLGGAAKVYEAAVKEAEQTLEWERIQVERDVRVAEFDVKSSQLELQNVVHGDGPAQLAQLEGEHEKARQERKKYAGFIIELEKLALKGYANAAETVMAKEKEAQLKIMEDVASRKSESYKNYTFPGLAEAAKAKVERAKMNLDRTEKGGKFRVAKAAASLVRSMEEMETAKAKLDTAKLEMEKTVLKAPFQGIVVHYETFRDNVKRKPRVGDSVWQGQQILSLPDISSFVVKTTVREIDLSKVRKGAVAKITVDAYSDKTFTGEVLFIGALAERQAPGGDKSFQVTVALKGGDKRFRPGMTARISILAEEVKDSLVVPVLALFGEGDERYCYRKTFFGHSKVKVKTGKRSEDYVEIVEGLNAGDRVSLVIPAS